jgi:hypothetical protein
MPALAATDVRLIGAFHVFVVLDKRGRRVAEQRSIAAVFARNFSTVTQLGPCAETAAHGLARLSSLTTQSPSSTPVEKCVECGKSLQIGPLFIHRPPFATL